MEVRVLKMKNKTVFQTILINVKNVEMTTNIETIYFQTLFDICINDKYLDKDQSFQDHLCHTHYNIFSHSEKNFLIV